MLNGEYRIQEVLNEIKEIEKTYNELMKRLKGIEGKVSVEKRRVLSNIIPTSISLYIDCDEALFKDGSLRSNAIEFLRWCIANFKCYLLTSLAEGDFESICKSVNAIDIYSEINYINIDLYKKRYEAIDLYDDFYCITTNKYPASVTDIIDSDYNNRLVKMKKQPFDKIREALRKIMTCRVVKKIEEKEVLYKEEFGLYKSGGYFGGRGGRGWNYKHKKYMNFEISIDYINEHDFITTWSLKKRDKDDWIEESEEMFISNSYEELILHLENLPNILVDIDKKLSQSAN